MSLYIQSLLESATTQSQPGNQANAPSFISQSPVFEADQKEMILSEKLKNFIKGNARVTDAETL